MGTRAASGFRINGIDKVMYSQFDGYVEGLGSIMFKFAQSTTIEDLREAAIRLQLVSLDDECPEDLAARYTFVSNLDVSEQSTKDWYCVLREVQGKPEHWLKGVDHIIDASDFLTDSLDCEYAYIIDLDEEVLEIYKGWNKNHRAPGMYAAFCTNYEEAKDDEEDKYYGVALVLNIPLGSLEDLTAEQFIEIANYAMYGDEDDALIPTADLIACAAAWKPTL